MAAAAAGVAGPVGFLLIAFGQALVRPEVIQAHGWASWPSSMALGHLVGIPQTLAFLWLAGCYASFAIWALRPALHAVVATAGFLGCAVGDVLLAFPTDARGAGVSWHGTMHLAGVIVATVATLVATAGVTMATWRDPRWHVWRLVAPVPVIAAGIGLVAGFDVGPAKVIYVVGITAPAAVAAWLVGRIASEARSG
jgi:hypothetical protein